MRTILIFAFLFLPFLFAKSQTLVPYFSIGYGSSQHDDIKSLFNDIVGQVPFPVKTIEYFPDYYNYDLGFAIPFNQKRAEAGLSFSFASTGARANVKDYSGSYTVDFILKGTNVAAFISSRFLINKILDINGSFRLGMMNTSLGINEQYVLYEEKSTEAFSIKSESLTLEPIIEFSKSVKNFGFFFNASYFFDCQGKLHLPEDSEAILQINGEDATSNWSGYRVRCGVKYIIQNVF